MPARIAFGTLTALMICAFGPGSAAAQTDIHVAARLGDLERVATLLDADPELVNARTAEGETPLHYAASAPHPEVVMLLLERGADVNAADHRGLTALHLAARVRYPKLIQALLAAGADVSAADRDGETPLHLAARRLNPDGLRLLLAAGAEANGRNERGQTPLHVLGSEAREPEQLAALRGPLADLLMEYGADPSLLDRDGVPALHEPIEQPPRDGYRTYDQITQLLHDWAAAYPGICQLHDVGLSVQGRHLWALKISDNVGLDEDEPEFKYVSTMHGDEWVGNEMCLFFIEYLLTNYGADPRVTYLIDEIDIWVMPLMNPDGYVANSRYNAHGVDLNRNFPEGTHGDPNTTEGREPETAAVMNWTFANSFTLSANFHAGALVVNYPYDNDGMGSVYSPTPDDDLFIWISEEYSRHNLPMWNSGSFYHGITNGAAWYAISGGMQDWHYRYMADNEVTIELSDNKRPPYGQIPQFWNDNRESMLAYMETCLLGVRGIVTDVYTGLPVAATVTVVGRAHPVYTDPDVGDYHRMLLPGTYDLRFEAEGYDPLVVRNVVVSAGPATRLDVQLSPPPQIVYPNGGESLTVNVPVLVQWTGNPLARFQVQYTANYGHTQIVTDGFESGSLGPEYTSGGNLPWTVTSAVAHSGLYSARAGAITHNQKSWLARSACEGPLGFWYRVSSEANYDWFNFYIDDVRVIHRSGNVGWTYYSTVLPSGSHQLTWEYTKDESVSYGNDTAWIDDLELTDDQTLWSDIVALTEPGAASTLWTPTVVGEDYKVRVRSYLDGNYGQWDESDDIFAVVEGPTWPLGDMNCDHSVDFGDINPFVLALTNPAAYAVAFPGCPITNGDINQDGRVDFGDINPFVRLLIGP